MINKLLGILLISMVCSSVWAQSFIGSSPFVPQVKKGAGVWADFDLDNRQDLFLTGIDSAGNNVGYLLRNTGSGFVQVAGTGIMGLKNGDAAWGDSDGDGDPDLIVTGEDSSGNQKTMLYRNNLGSFTLVATPDLPGLMHSRVLWADFDGDGDLDLFLAGYNKISGLQGLIGRNDGNNTFTAVRNPLYQTREYPVIAVGDFDVDGKVDLAFSDISPVLTEGIRTVILRNLGGLQFAVVSSMAPGFYDGSLQFKDEDLDGDLDLLCAGTGIEPICESYRYQAGQFQPGQRNLVGVSHGEAKWADFNGDGRLDVFSSGHTLTGFETRLYLWTSGGYVLQQGPIGLPAIYHTRISIGNFNNDGFPDVLLMGETQNGVPVTKIGLWNTGTENLQF